MFFNIFKYNLFIRIVFSFVFSFLFSFFFGNFFLFFLNKNKVYQGIRDLNIKSNSKKKNIPIMGGVVTFVSILLMSFIFVNINNINIIILLFYFVFNFFVGLIDDYIKFFCKSYDGLSIRDKFLFQSLITLIFIFFLLYFKIYIYKNNFYLRYLVNNNVYCFFLWYFLLICGINSINFTDGLDGLLTLPLIFVSLFLFLVSLCSSNIYLSSLFKIPYIFYAKDLIIINSILLGTLLSFLRFNFYPAKLFLGDVGSLSLGSLVTMMFILLRKEWYFIIVGYLFFIELISVLFQVFLFKFFNKRLFMMSPIHHHYELLGYTEINIVINLWIVSFFSFFLSCLLFFRI